MVSVKKISTEETYFLRLEVLRKGIDLPHKFKEDFDVATFHLGVFEGEKLMSIGSFIKNELEALKGSQYQLRGMATLPEGRGKGYGKLLLDEASEELKTMSIEKLWCNAREEAVKFYEKSGFQIFGEEFMVNKVGPHYKMCRSL